MRTLIIGVLLLGLAGCRTGLENEKEPRAIVEGPVAGGCENADYPDWRTSAYVLPFPVGQRYRVDLSNCTTYTHSPGRPDEFGYDFNMPVGSRVSAARSGKVIYVEESGHDGAFPNNLVVVDHGDDTFAQYMHFTRNGVWVEVGDSLNQGDIVGLSGYTGLAGYPHLHFVVTRENWRWPYKSIPVTFRNTVSNVRGLASGYVYEAFSYNY